MQIVGLTAADNSCTGEILTSSEGDPQSLPPKHLSVLQEVTESCRVVMSCDDFRWVSEKLMMYLGFIKCNWC